MKLRNVSLSDKYSKDEGQIFLTGVQALVRLPMLQRSMDLANGLNTAGYVSGYPGSPLASLDIQYRAAQDLLKEKGVHFQPGLNEDLALTSVWGSQQGEARGDSRYDGVFAYWYGKGAGLDRSGDALRHGNLAGSSPKGGVLLLLGDDHKAESSSVAHYSEYTMLDFMIPVLNPANVEELIEFGLYGIALSRYSGSWAALKCTHDVVESAASIEIDTTPRQYAEPTDFTMPPGGLHLRYPDTPLAQEDRIYNQKLPAVQAFSRANSVDRVIWPSEGAKVGLITAGKTYFDILDGLEELGITEEVAREIGLAFYKVGISWPLAPERALSFCSGLDRIMIVEEKRPLIESQLKDLLYNKENAPLIVGKKDEAGNPLLPQNGTLSNRAIALAVGRQLRAAGLEGAFLEKLTALEAGEKRKVIPFSPMDRRPSFCSGCPHNRSTVVPADSRGGAGTGCNYMVMWMDRGSVGYTQMGADGVNWIGEAPFSNRKHVFQNMGDGTYTHSGVLAIRAAVAARVNITFKVLFNGVVAMTGGQPHDFQLNVSVIASQALSEGAKKVVVVADDPDRHSGASLPAGVTVHHRDQLDAVQRELREVEGVTVLIYDQMCATEKRRLRKRGKLEDPAKRVFINDKVCEGCGDCGMKSNCVSVAPRETEFGRKRQIDQSTCNKDFSCVEGFCPSFVTVLGGELRKNQKSSGSSDTAKAPPLPVPAALDKPFNIVMAGVGGTGVITLAAILGMAAHLEGKGCTTLDMMGLAQKGGAVTSHIRIGATPDDIRGARIPDSRADVILGFDLLAAIAAEPISTAGYKQTKVFVNTNEAMPGDFARKPDLDFPTLGARERIEAAVGDEMVTYIDSTSLAERAIGDTIASNTMLLGYVFQQGLLPLSLESIERAFELNGVAVDMNKKAFLFGRQAAAGTLPALQKAAPAAAATDVLDLDGLIAHRRQFLTDYQNRAYADAFASFVDEVRKAEQRMFGSVGDFTYQVAWNLAKLMAYKDEYEVARLYTDGTFMKELMATVTGDTKLRFNLAPPIFARRDPATGHLRKSEYGAWVFKAFKVLAALKWLRGTALDPFGRTSERRMERQLIASYRDDIMALLPRLNAQNYGVAVEIAALPGSIRGYGHIKDAAIGLAVEQRDKLMAAFERPPMVAAAE